MRPLTLVTLLVASLAFDSPAYAGRYTCKAAQNLARLAATDRDAVVVEPDDAKKECRFSINGEPAGSPPREAILQASNFMRSGDLSNVLFSKKDVDWLALLLLAASTEDRIDDNFRRLLLAHTSQLGNCFKALEAGLPSGLEPFNNNRDLFCRASPRGGAQFNFDGKFWVEAVSAVPLLAVGAMRSSGASYLFVPFSGFRPPFSPPR